MSSRHSFHFASLCGILALLCAGGLRLPSAAADTLTLGTGINQTWNRPSSPGASPVMTLPFINNVNNANGIILAYTLGMRLEPTAGATGTLAVGTVSNPATNPIFASIVTPPTVNVQSGFTSIGIENSQLALAPVPLAGKNAIDFTLTSTDALGTFNIVIDGTSSRSGWNDLDSEYSFGNAADTTLTVGQINVVPEPGALAFVGTAVVIIGLATVRRFVRPVCHSALR